MTNNDNLNEITVVIEIPTGSRNKYEIDHESGEIWLDRYLFTSTQYPHDYGFVPNTLSEDGDPIDAFVLLEEPTFPGCHIHVRAIGMLEMTDEAGCDEKLLCVPSTDPRFSSVQDITDVKPHVLEEIKHFLEVYKDLEKDKHAILGDWLNAEQARTAINSAIKNFKNKN
ncbi:MAG: inorganic diphosphatase [Acidimicrobiia bacterium]|nr:inorganic diphosphatase [Acidimicrobiia bacterium]